MKTLVLVFIGKAKDFRKENIIISGTARKKE